MDVQPRKLDKLKKRLQEMIKQNDLQSQRLIIQQLCTTLDINPLDCAAALLKINQPHLCQNPSPETSEAVTPLKPFKPALHRTVRYRLDIGKQHGIDQEQLLAVIIEESGVDRKRINRLDIRDHYTLIDLPDGMPADIFQLLAEATIAGRPLNIKRIKGNRKKFREPKHNGEY